MINSSKTLKERLKYSTFFCKTMFSYKQTVTFLQFPQRKHKLQSTIYYTSYGILKIIKNLDPNKAHGHDKYSDDKNL